MKTIAHYIDEILRDLMKECEAFTAFSNFRFHEMKQDEVRYVKVGAGIYCPKDYAEYFIKAYNKHESDARKKDIAENGKDGVIIRELKLHDCFNTGDHTPALEAVEGHGITEDEVLMVFSDEWEKQEN